jgi:hypothetical protein
VAKIIRVAGTGTTTNGGDDGPATDAGLNFPLWVAATADGGFLISDSVNNVVRKVSAAGIITRVAGTGTAGYAGDDGPATDAELAAPTAVAMTADGGFLIVDQAGRLVREVSAAGVITRVAGGVGAENGSGDDGPATEAGFGTIVGVAVTADGGFLITDQVENVVRKVSAAGVITRVAGSGTAGYTGDGGPATDADLTGPSGVAATADGGFLIAHGGRGGVVRKVSAARVITTVAGNGTGGYSGDGGPATEAELYGPVGVALTPDGGFLITDAASSVVRKVSAGGVITTVAGNGTRGYSGDGGPATEAEFDGPWGVAVTADGGIVIVDSNNNVVRKVLPA